MSPITLPAPYSSPSGDEFASFGTGRSVYPGVEHIYEINGLTLNDRSVIEKYRITEIDGFGDADIRDAREVLPGQTGEIVFDAFYGGRTIVLTGRIEAYTLSKMRDMQESLKLAFSSLVESRLYVRAQPFSRQVFIKVRKSAPMTMRESQTNWSFFRDFQVTLRASDPLLYSVENVAQIMIPANSYDLAHKGNFPSPPIIVLDGEQTDPVITNTLTSEELRLTGTIAAGDQIIVDILRNSIVNQDGDNRFQMFDVTSDWLTLAYGVNSIAYAATDPDENAKATLTYYNTWI